MKTMDVDGRCLCGYITYEATVNPASTTICNCTDCQTHSGSAFSVSVGVVDEQFRLLSGELKHYEKIGSSGTPRSLGFCPECGTRFYGRTVGEGTRWMSLRVGTMHQRAQLTPRRQIWCRSAQAWTDDTDQMPKFDKQPSLDDIANTVDD